MPLTQGCSKKAAQKNYSKLINEGYTEQKAYAITFRIARDNMKKCGSKRRQELKQGDLMG